MSRIFYDGKYFDYPLQGHERAARTSGSSRRSAASAPTSGRGSRPPKDQTNFEGWIVVRFGWRLYRIFFKTYTEKVWGVPASEIPADWAAQRIKNLSLGKAIVNALLPKRNQKEITSLIEEFQYPKYGPGMMWEVCRDKVVDAGHRGRDGRPRSSRIAPRRRPGHRSWSPAPTAPQRATRATT